MTSALHVDHALTQDVQRRLDRWEAEARLEPSRGPRSWQLATIWIQARSATVEASTAIRGCPLTDEQVDAVLGGSQVGADPFAIREIVN